MENYLEVEENKRMILDLAERQLWGEKKEECTISYEREVESSICAWWEGLEDEKNCNYTLGEDITWTRTCEVGTVEIVE